MSNSTDILEVSVFQYELKNHVDIRLTLLKEQKELSDEEKSELQELQIVKKYFEKRVKELSN